MKWAKTVVMIEYNLAAKSFGGIADSQLNEVSFYTQASLS